MDDREKLIELLEQKCHDDWYSNEEIADHLIANGVTVSGEIEELRADNERLREMWAKAVSDLSKTKVQRWIPFAERLPEEDGEYLVWFDRNMFEHYAEVRHFAKDGETVDEYDLHHEKNVWYYYDSEWGYVACLNVTHWMPLPEPPKEDE